ncbi:MAG: electron transfer flavoprotein subunit alpha/FixB family protein [Dehalococcoidia bacterium]|nr:electron transfer flavoprotein subunit alpha/FixB family protein [Dehalococcoidia bacterium]
MSEIWALIEQEKGEPKKISLEMATLARRLADQSGATAAAVVIGPGAKAAAEKVGGYGIGKAYVKEDNKYAEYAITPQAHLLAGLIKDKKPSLVLVGSTSNGRDIAARVAARLKLGILANVVDVGLEDGKVRVVAPAFGGNIEVTSQFVNMDTEMVTVRPNAVMPVKSAAQVQVEDIAGDVGAESLLGKIIERMSQETGAVPLEEAQFIISGGRGVGGQDGFKMIYELANALGGAVGASRAAVDAGWIAYPHQVGQTGKTVKPIVYIACGISGAIQHKVGMQTADVIVAINKNADAPIFQFADFGVVGDIFQIVPKLTEEVKKYKKS